MTFRFIHSSDLHLGKRFGQFEGDLSARLQEARHDAIGRFGHCSPMRLLVHRVVRD